MAGSQDKTLPGADPSVPADRTPGPTGKNDAADPDRKVTPGDTAGPVGVNDKAAAASKPADPSDPAIEALDLNATAKAAAYDLKKQFPAVSFTSGRRDKGQQASAMASNVVSNRKWIEQTYTKTTASTACQKWVDDNPKATTQAEIAEGLKGVLDGLSDDELGRLSKHLSGDAFDVQPVTTDANAIKEAIRALVLPSGGKFLEMEGGLVRWHAQF